MDIVWKIIVGVIISLSITFVIFILKSIPLFLKAINPFKKKYIKNPKGGNLTMAQQKSINIGAILEERNLDYIDSLSTSKKSRKHAMTLYNCWGVAVPKNAYDTLDGLKDSGHRIYYEAIQKDITVLEGLKFQSYADIYIRIKDMLMTQKEKAKYEEYHQYLNIIDMQTDILDIKKEILFERNDLFSNKEQKDRFLVFRNDLLDTYNKYIYYIEKLKESLTVLHNKGIIQDILELQDISILSWDMGRLVNVARWCYDCGYISEDTAWSYINFAYEQSRQCYNSWESFAKGYIVGRAMWNGNDSELKLMINIAHRLQRDKNSPWNIYPW